MEEQTVVMPGGVGAGPEATRVMTTPPGAGMYGGAEATQMAVTVTCPVCGTPNPPSELFCQDCGLLFSSVSGDVEQLPDSADLPRLVDSSGREFLLNPGVNTVGRENADILLAEGTISRRHAQVTLEEDRLLVEDLGSTNGTAVAGAPVRPGAPASAYQGDTVKFGSVTLTVSLPGGGARPAALAPPSPAEEPAGPRLGAIRLPDGTEQPLLEGVTTIGRRSTNRIVLADPFASGAHAEIRAESGSVVLVDLGSTNGTFIAGERVAPQNPIPVTEGLTVTFGKTPLTFHLESGAEEASAGSDAEESVAVMATDQTVDV